MTEIQRRKSKVSLIGPPLSPPPRIFSTNDENHIRMVNTVSLKCPCGYIKHDVMCLGDVVDAEQMLFHFCGGLFILHQNGVQCAKCNKTAKQIDFQCSFCGRQTSIPVQQGKPEANFKIKQCDQMHRTFVFTVAEHRTTEAN